MTRNYIWGWGSSLETLGCVEYPFITITLRSCFGAIYESNKSVYNYSIGIVDAIYLQIISIKKSFF